MGFIAKPLDLIDYIPKGRKNKHLPLLKLADDNPFLGQLLATLKAEKNMGEVLMFNWPETNTMVELLYASGYVDKIHSFDDFADDVNVFWDLVDCARDVFLVETGKTNRGIVATCFLYDRLRHSHIFTERFQKDPHSPFRLLGKRKLLALLANDKVRRNNFFYLQYASNRYMEFVLPLGNDIINERIIITMLRHRIYEGNAYTSRSIVERFGDLFIEPTKFCSNADFNGTQLHHAIDQILLRFTEDENYRRCTMKFLFDVYQDLVMDFPKHDFFADNDLYSTEIILSGDTANKLAAGFKLVVAGREDEIPAYRKVLFIVNRNEYRTATGRSIYLRSVDFSHIIDDKWRMIMMNYAQYRILEGNYEYIDLSNVIEDYIDECKYTASRYHISVNDMIEIKARLAFRSDLKTGTKNGMLCRVRRFVNWAVRRGYLTVEAGALKEAANFRDRYTPEPRSIQGINIKAIDKALTELGRKHKHYLLTREIFHIQLNSEARIGEIISLLVDDLHFMEDGGCRVVHKAKNAGYDPNERIYSTEAAGHLLKAMDLSREARRACPGLGMNRHVFVYNNGKTCHSLFSVMSTNRYNWDLRDACKLAGIEPVSSGNVRDTAMTGMKKMSKEKNLSDQITRAFVGHKDKVSTNAYYDIDFRDVMEAARGVSLGTIELEED